MTLNTIGCLKRLAMMGFDDRRVFYVVAVDAERGSILSKVIGKLALLGIARFMNDVAGVAATIKGWMTAATFGNMHADIMTVKTEVYLLAARHRL